MRCFKGLPKLSKSGSYGSGKLVGERSRHHTLRSAHKQRVSKTSSQPRDGVAEGRLTKPYLFRRSTDMPLIDQRFKRKQQIEIDSADTRVVAEVEPVDGAVIRSGDRGQDGLPSRPCKSKRQSSGPSRFSDLRQWFGKKPAAIVSQKLRRLMPQRSQWSGLKAAEEQN